MHRGGFGCQVVDHVLIVLPDAFRIVERLAIQREPNTIWPIPDIKILRAHASNNTHITHLNAVAHLWE